jgi:ATP-binding cassette subfamily F protein 2
MIERYLLQLCQLFTPSKVTGYLTSLEKSRDIKIEQFSMSTHGHVLVSDTSLEFNFGRRYGLLGFNGCGKYRNQAIILIPN